MDMQEHTHKRPSKRRIQHERIYKPQSTNAAAGAPSIDTVQVMEGGQPSPTASSDSDDAFTVLHDNNSPVIVTRPVVPNSTAVQDSNGTQQQHQNIGDPVTDRIRIQAKDYENYLYTLTNNEPFNEAEMFFVCISRFNKRKATYFRTIQPSTYHSKVPSKHIYIY